MAKRLWLNDGLLLDCTSLRSRLVQIDLPGMQYGVKENWANHRLVASFMARRTPLQVEC